jgi:hypothetical protein
MKANISIKKLEAFNKKVERIVLEHGGIVSPHGYKWILNTKAGELLVSVHEARDKGYLYSIFCCFENPKEALKLLVEVGLEAQSDPRGNGKLNRYSGKWNYHHADERDTLVSFEMNIEKLGVNWTNPKTQLQNEKNS